MNSFGLFSPQPFSAPLPYPDITPERRSFIIKKAAPVIPSGAVAKCAPADALVVDGNKEIEALASGAIKKMVDQQRAAVSERVVRGLANIAEVHAIETPNAEEIAERIVRISEFMKKPIADARPYVLEIHAAVVKSVKALVTKMEEPEKALAAEFGVEFVASQPLALAQSVAMWLERITPPPVYNENEGLPSPLGSLHYLGAGYKV